MGLKISKENYYIDLDELFRYCYVDNKPKDEYHQKEISDSYEIDKDNGNLRLSQKLIHEVVSPNGLVIDENKYELIKLLILQVFSDGDKKSNTLHGFSQILAFNTLFNNKFIKKV